LNVMNFKDVFFLVHNDTTDTWSIGINIHTQNQTAIGICLVILAILLLTLIRLRYYRKKAQVKQLEQMVINRTAELETSSLAKSRFVAALSHEIRNPLNGIVGGIRQLEPDKPISRELISSLHRPTVYLARLLNNALDFARYESGKQTYRPSQFNLNEFIRVAIDVYGDTARRHELAIITDTCDIQIISDRHALETILLNLISNAIRFTPKGGYILVSINLNETTKTLELRVRDSGFGIPKSELEKIFQAFTQSSVPPAIHGERGSGVGLTLISQILTLLNGTVKVESEPTIGSVFTIQIPVEIPEQTEDTPKSKNTERRISALKGTYLVVDDLDYNAQSLAATLRTLGATCHTSSTGMRSVSLAEQTRYDAIFMDIDLPDISGIEAAQMIRHKHPAIKMIALTAYASQAILEAEKEGIFDSVAEKPLDTVDLRNLMESLLPSKVETSTNTNDVFSKERYDINRLRWLSDLEQKPIGEIIDGYVNDLDRLSGNPVSRGNIHQLKGHLAFIKDIDGCDLAKRWLHFYDQNPDSVEMQSITHDLQQHCNCVAREIMAYKTLYEWKSSDFTNPFSNA